MGRYNWQVKDAVQPRCTIGPSTIGIEKPKLNRSFMESPPLTKTSLPTKIAQWKF